MRLVIVTGMSGAGKSTAMKMLEDAQYFCCLLYTSVKTEYYILFALGFFVSEFIIKIFRRKVNERKDGISLI